MKAKSIIFTSVLIFVMMQKMTAQPPLVWTTCPLAATDPVVHTTDPGVTNALEWSAASWLPAWAGWGDATSFKECREAWTAVCPTGTMQYPALTLFDYEAVSALRTRDLWDFETVEINYSGHTITMWIFGNPDNPAVSDWRWIGGSGIGRTSINDEDGFLVRHNNNPATDRQFFNATDVSPGDPAFNFSYWYGVFGHYSFNNTPWRFGLNNSRPWNHENYEECIRGLGVDWWVCWGDVWVKKCKFVDGVWYNDWNENNIFHLGPPPDDPDPGIVPGTGHHWAPTGTYTPLTFVFVNYSNNTITVNYTVTSQLGAPCNPPSGTVNLPPHGYYETEITALDIVGAGLPPDIITVTDLVSGRSAHTELEGTNPLSDIVIFPGDFTIPLGTKVYLTGFGSDDGGRPLPLPNSVWTTTNGLATLRSMPPGHAHVPEIAEMAEFEATAMGDGDVILSSGSISGLVHITVVSPDPLTVSAEITEISCSGQSDGTISTAARGGFSPYSYLWSNGSTTSWITGLSADTYSLIVTDANSNTTTGNWTLNEPSELSVSAQVMPVTCHNGNDGMACLYLSGGTYPYSVLWSTGENTECLYYLSAGTYSYTVQDAHGCAAGGSVDVTEPAEELLLSATVYPASCRYASDGRIDATVSGGTLPYSFYWSTNENTEDIDNLLPGMYGLMVHDGSYCSAYTYYEVGYIDPVCQNITVSGDVYNYDDLCYEAETSIVVAGAPPYENVYAGGKLTLISRGNIIFLPGVTVYQEGMMHGFIATGDEHCPVYRNGMIISAAPDMPQEQQDMKKGMSFFRVYPNPTTGLLTLELAGSRNMAETEVAIYNLTGKKVMMQKIAGQMKYEISLEGMPPGLYLLRIVSGNEAGSVKILKQ